MNIVITGATGRVGYPVTQHFLRLGHRVTTLGRQALPGVAHIPWDLADPVPDLGGQDHVVHAAFAHQPGKYRGGEGHDPDGFIALNLKGTLALWAAARTANVHAVFLSSRAVYDGYPPGTLLTEDMDPWPTTLYGRVKAEAEAALGDGGISIRATGVVGPAVPGTRHKWANVFDRYREGKQPHARIGTEIHVKDIACAVEIVLHHSLSATALNASGFLLDHRDLLEEYGRVTDRTGPLPDRSDPAAVKVMSTRRLRRLGWSPTGPEAVTEVIRSIVAAEPP